MNIKLINQIDTLLPQTQCTRCGYPSCRKYAIALADGEAEINQCPPGGDEGIAALAKLLNRATLSLNPDNGVIKARQLAVIDEEACIGCTLCIKACPVDAIIGANKMMHTVINTECSGCDLCIPACPVDCISMITDPDQDWNQERRDKAKARFDKHDERHELERKARDTRLVEQARLLKKVQNPDESKSVNSDSKSDFITQILAKAKEQIK